MTSGNLFSPEEEKRKGRKALSIILVAFASFALLAYVSFSFTFVRTELKLLRSVSVGMPEMDLLRKLGQPKHVLYKGESVKSYMGSDFPSLPVENKVFVYYHERYTTYVYIGRNGRVEYIFWGDT